MNLQTLLGNTTIKDFFDDYWTKNELHISGDENKFENILTINEFVENLKKSIYNIAVPNIELIKDGIIIPIEEYTASINPRKSGFENRYSFSKIVDLCSDGATLTYKNMQYFSSSLSDLHSAISTSFQERVNINSYLSQPGGSFGYNTHYDTHEIFALQIAGEKLWKIYDFSLMYPLNIPEHKSKLLEPPQNEPKEYSMKQGDVLYIPRGKWHSAIAKDKSSLHLTIGVHVLKRLDFINWILTQDEFFRQNFRKEPIGLNKEIYLLDDEYIHTIINKMSELITNNMSQCLIDFYKSALKKQEKNQINLPFI